MTTATGAVSSALTQKILAITPPIEFYVHASPILIFLLSAIFAVVVGIFRADPDKPNFPAMGIAMAACLTAIVPPLARPVLIPAAYLGSGFLADSITQFGMIGITLGTLVTLLFASCTNTGRNLLRAELVALLLTASAGLMVMVSAGEFLTFFVGLELASVPLYVLVGFQRDTRPSLEAALKYFLLGSVASALIIMGMAFLYLHTGSLAWSSLHNIYLVRTSPYAVMGILLFVSGISFKLALSPFHFWAPDVYQGANSILTGYMASMVKFGVVLALMRILSAGMHDEQRYLMWIFWILGALSIIVGSLYGLVQRSIKRLLAYSSVANAGYFALSFAVLAYNPGNELAKQALISYVAIYAVLTLGSFGVLAWLEDGSKEDLERKSLNGLGSKNPFAAICFSIFLVGLAGIPPVAGFFGKLWILNSAVSGGLVGLAVILAIFSTVSLFYYLSLISSMWFHPPTSETPLGILDVTVASRMRWTVAILAAISIIIGLVGPRWALNMNTRMARQSSLGYHQQGE
jgi:NADH-quinone oxidoreductase subunit N